MTTPPERWVISLHGASRPPRGVHTARHRRGMVPGAQRHATRPLALDGLRRSRGGYLPRGRAIARVAPRGQFTADIASPAGPRPGCDDAADPRAPPARSPAVRTPPVADLGGAKGAWRAGSLGSVASLRDVQCGRASTRPCGLAPGSDRRLCREGVPEWLRGGVQTAQPAPGVVFDLPPSTEGLRPSGRDRDRRLKIPPHGRCRARGGRTVNGGARGSSPGALGDECPDEFRLHRGRRLDHGIGREFARALGTLVP